MGKIGSNATKQNLAAQTIQILVARIKKFTLIYEVEIINFFLVACYATLHPPMSICPSVGRSVGPFFTFLAFLSFWAHCSCLNAPVTSITAPAHLHATRVAMYPALFLKF